MAKAKHVAKDPVAETGKFGVFLSWSGDTSRKLAEAIGSLIPNVFQDVKTFVSSNDIDAGSSWFGRISEELNATEFGVLCLTNENLAKQWIHFEAGALAKRIADRARVVPYVHGVDVSDLSPPLSMFQAVKADKEGTHSLIRSLNSVRGEPFEQSRLTEIFEKWWPEFEEELRSLPPAAVTLSTHRPDRELLEELLALARASQKPVTNSGAAFDFTRPTAADPFVIQMTKQSLRTQLLVKIAELEASIGKENDAAAKYSLGTTKRLLEDELRKSAYYI
jgi:hypothetical protein